MAEPENAWHLDRRVPLGIILALAAQTVAIVYVAGNWKAETDGRLKAVEAAIADNAQSRREQWDAIQTVKTNQHTLDARLAGLDERTRSIAQQTERILDILLAGKADKPAAR